MRLSFTGYDVGWMMNISLPDALTDHYLRLTIVELADECIAEIDADMISDLLR